MQGQSHDSRASLPVEPRDWLRRLDASADAKIEPLSDLPTRVTTEELIGAAAVRWAVVTARRAADYIADTLPVFGSEPGALQLLRRAVESTTLAVLRALRTGDVDMLWPGTEPSDSTASYVRRQIPLEQVIRGIHLCQEVLTSELQKQIGLLVDSREVVNETHETTLLLFRSFDRFSANIATHYSREAEQWAHSSTAARAELIDRVLSSPNFIDVSGTSAALAYRLDNESVGLALWLDDPHPGPEATPALERVIDRILLATGRPNHLSRWAGPATVYIWLQSGHAAVQAQLSALGENQLAHARLAIGQAAPAGVHGFRLTHTTARKAEAVARLARSHLPRLVTFESVEMAALMLTDITALRHFVRSRLAGLAVDDDRTRELRETLRTYLAAGRSLNQAAKELHTHRNTIVYRIKSAEALLPATVDLDSVELRLALHLSRLLGDAVLGGGSDQPA